MASVTTTVEPIRAAKSVTPGYFAGSGQAGVDLVHRELAPP